jgi:hypothetical protein
VVAGADPRGRNPPLGHAGYSIDIDSRRHWAQASVVVVTFVWDPGRPCDAWVQVETAVGVLMELCGWEAAKARARLVSAAVSANAPVETIAAAILALGPEHPPRWTKAAAAIEEPGS